MDIPDSLVTSVFAILSTCIVAPILAPASATGDADTIRVEVGSPAVNARVYQPHAARVRVQVDGQVTTEWTNHLTLGDSAGRPVMRWVTRGTRDIGSWAIYQTYDGVTMAPLGYLLTSQAGARIQLTFDGKRVRGTRKTPADSVAQPVDVTLSRAGFIASASDLVPMAVGLQKGSVIVAPVWGPNMPDAELRVFTVVDEVPVDVEGTKVKAWKVEERVLASHKLTGTWYLTTTAPYMVAGEVPLPNGTVQWMTEVSIPNN